MAEKYPFYFDLRADGRGFGFDLIVEVTEIIYKMDEFIED